jgi:hypothetical protein
MGDEGWSLKELRNSVAQQLFSISFFGLVVSSGIFSYSLGLFSAFDVALFGTFTSDFLVGNIFPTIRALIFVGAPVLLINWLMSGAKNEISRLKSCGKTSQARFLYLCSAFFVLSNIVLLIEISRTIYDYIEFALFIFCAFCFWIAFYLFVDNKGSPVLRLRLVVIGYLFFLSHLFVKGYVHTIDKMYFHRYSETYLVVDDKIQQKITILAASPENLYIYDGKFVRILKSDQLGRIIIQPNSYDVTAEPLIFKIRRQIGLSTPDL